MRATFAIKQFMMNQYWITPILRSAKGVPMNDHWAINGLILLGYLARLSKHQILIFVYTTLVTKAPNIIFANIEQVSKALNSNFCVYYTDYQKTKYQFLPILHKLGKQQILIYVNVA